MSREAMKLALEALEWNMRTDLDNIKACEHWAYTCKNAINKLREALAQKDEPVAYVTGYYKGYCVVTPINPSVVFNAGTAFFYAAPPQREWQGLTDEEVRQAAQAMDAEPLAEGWKELIKFARAIEQSLKEKNT